MNEDGIQVGGCQGLGEEGMGSDCFVGIVFPFGDDESVLELGRENGCTTL